MFGNGKRKLPDVTRHPGVNQGGTYNAEVTGVQEVFDSLVWEFTVRSGHMGDVKLNDLTGLVPVMGTRLWDLCQMCSHYTPNPQTFDPKSLLGLKGQLVVDWHLGGMLGTYDVSVRKFMHTAPPMAAAELERIRGVGERERRAREYREERGHRQEIERLRAEGWSDTEMAQEKPYLVKALNHSRALVAA